VARLNIDASNLWYFGFGEARKSVDRGHSAIWFRDKMSGHWPCQCRFGSLAASHSSQRRCATARSHGSERGGSSVTFGAFWDEEPFALKVLDGLRLFSRDNEAIRKVSQRFKVVVAVHPRVLKSCDA
jgi:hypothetical protein